MDCDKEEIFNLIKIIMKYSPDKYKNKKLSSSSVMYI